MSDALRELRERVRAAKARTSRGHCYREDGGPEHVVSILFATAADADAFVREFDEVRKEDSGVA